jgi:hypothetical protein
MKKTWILAMALLAACSNTHITSSWKNDQVPPVHYSRVMVLATVPDNQRNIRQAMEHSMVEQLRHSGYNAVSALQEFGPGALQGLSEQAALVKVKADQADGLITISQINSSHTRQYVPGTIYPSPWGWGWGYGGGYYSPGYVHNEVHFSWQTNFYDVNTAKVIYSVQSKSFDPTSANDLAVDYSHQIVRDMKEKGVLVKQSRKDMADR